VSEPLSYEREQGIRLTVTNPRARCSHAMVGELLAELDRLRKELSGVESELSVMRRGNAPKYTASELRVLRYALALAADAGVSQADGFAPGDGDVLRVLRRRVSS
jgi:hypothetical protein